MPPETASRHGDTYASYESALAARGRNGRSRPAPALLSLRSVRADKDTEGNYRQKQETMEIIKDDREPKRLYRSRRRIIGGVCQGLADYFNVDVVLVRIIALFALFCLSAGFWVYLVLWIAVPLEPVSGSGDNYRRK